MNHLRGESKKIHIFEIMNHPNGESNSGIYPKRQYSNYTLLGKKMLNYHFLSTPAGVQRLSLLKIMVDL